ncbi:MAG: KamA family radical SAM protein [Gammaproteobacteria bacterium]
MASNLPLEKTWAGSANTLSPTKFKAYTERNFDQIPQLGGLSAETKFEMRVVASVLPFRVNDYVLDELIDWSNIPADPIFQLTFPQRGMLTEDAFSRMADALHADLDAAAQRQIANEIRQTLNPHPAHQQTLNVPEIGGEPLDGIQHKYRETVLFFPSQGQVCHAYCTFCFRWAQFVGDKALRFASAEMDSLKNYLIANPDVSDILITGGDPMVMKSSNLATYLDGLLDPRLAHVRTIRIGTKAVSYWPQRFVSDPDADDLLRSIERVVESGKQVAIMMHLNHWQELMTPIAERAIARLRETGAILRAQAPVLRHINDNADDWAQMWSREVALGIYPYYMFVERDTGAKAYFELPLEETWLIYRDAMQQVSGLARTARGPSMSAGPGKVEIQGVTEIHGEKVFVLRFIQGRNPDWVQKPFFAKYDPVATWLDELRPAFGERFFFESEYNAMLSGSK